MEHGVVGAGVPVLETRGRHAGQAVHATVVRPVSFDLEYISNKRIVSLLLYLPVGVCHGAWLGDGGIHGVEASIERQS